MGYFVTGATGFIGRHLVELLLEREGTIFVLVREGSKGRLEELRNQWGVDEKRVVGIVGDLSQRRLGVSDADVEADEGQRREPLPPRRDLRHDRRRRDPAGRERRGHPPHGRTRRGGRGRARPHGQLDRRRRPLRRHLARGHVRRGRAPQHPPLLPDQASVRGRGAKRVHPPVARLPARDRRRRLADGRDGQGRRPLLLLQGDPADPKRGSAVDADARGRGSRDQPRARRLRLAGARSHRPQARSRRPRLPPDRSQPADRRRGDRHLRQGCARARIERPHSGRAGRRADAVAQGWR